MEFSAGQGDRHDVMDGNTRIQYFLFDFCHFGRNRAVHDLFKPFPQEIGYALLEQFQEGTVGAQVFPVPVFPVEMKSFGIHEGIPDIVPGDRTDSMIPAVHGRKGIFRIDQGGKVSFPSRIPGNLAALQDPREAGGRENGVSVFADVLNTGKTFPDTQEIGIFKIRPVAGSVMHPVQVRPG